MPSHMVSQKVNKKANANKFVVGFLTMATVALVATGGAVSALGNGNGNSNGNGNGNGNTPGQVASGYGGQSAEVNLDLEVNGDDNIITIIINLFTGG